MAVAGRPPSTSRTPGGFWPSPEQFQEITPLVQLLTSIWAIPEVSRISVTATPSSIDLWVFMPVEDHAVEGRISLAERDFINATQSPGFTVNVLPGDDVSPDVLPANTVLFER